MNWLYLILGLWIAASPWLVDGFGLTLKWSNVAIGSVIALLSLWGLFGKK